MKITAHTEADLPAVLSAIGEHGFPCEVTVGDDRTSDQNRKLWAMLRDVSSQCQLFIDGSYVTASADDWKAVFLAALMGDNRVARGIDGGVVFLSTSSRKLTKRQFSELLEIIYAYGAAQGVRWSEPALLAYEQYREAL